MTKIYYIIDESKECLSNYQNGICVWAKKIQCAMSFTKYQKAYYLAKKICKLYGFEKCSVASITEKDSEEEFNYLQNKAK